jgi:glucokinase
VKIFIGLDIGGTKCAVSRGAAGAQTLEILAREEFPTAGLSWREVLEAFARRIEAILAGAEKPELAAIGISCGGPLDSARGLILSPPNLPGWDNVPVVSFFQDRFGVPTAVQNDANACALA